MQWTCMLLIGLGGATAACDRHQGRGEAAPAAVIDSFLPRDEAIRRFQQNLPRATALESSYQSRDALLAAFVAALGGRDTAALASLAVSRAEFGYLYYPATPQSLPPYDLEPGLMWDLLQRRSDRGIRRALAAYGGRPLQLLSHDCGQGSSREGANTIVGPCVLQLRDKEGKAVSPLLLNQIIERGGRYKVLSYANRL